MSATYAQQARQRARGRDGRYDALNPCEACGKSAGADYLSNPYTLEAASIGLVLCNRKRCMASMPEDTAEAVAFLRAKKAERGAP
jgi:hypothetical protein